VARTRSQKFPQIQRTILKRAAAVFAERGYSTSSMADLTRATKLSRGALYHYFSSKEAILSGILEDHVSLFLERIEATLAVAADPAQQLRQVTRAIVALNTQCPQEQTLLLNELNQLSSPVRRKVEALERRILDLLSELLERVDTGGRITAGNRRVHTMIFLGIVNYTFAWYDPKGRVSPEEYAELAVDVFLHGFIRSPAPNSRVAPARRATPARTNGVARAASEER